MSNTGTDISPQENRLKQMEAEKNLYAFWAAILFLALVLSILVFISVYQNTSDILTPIIRDLIECVKRVSAGAIVATLSYLIITYQLKIIKNRFANEGISVDTFDQKLSSIDNKVEDIQEIIDGYNPTISRLINKVEREKYDDINLYTFYGLGTDLSNNPVLQNFSEQYNCIQYLWAASGNKVWHSIEPDNDNNRCLQISFDNNNDGGSNIAIHLSENKAHCTKNFKYLTFQAKIIKENDTEENILLAFRLVNGQLAHRRYKGENENPDCFTTLLLKNTEWKYFSLDIRNKDRWSLFEGDGNHLYDAKKVDFNVISSIVFELGSLKNDSNIPKESKFMKSKELGKGKGKLQIKNIELTKDNKTQTNVEN